MKNAEKDAEKDEATTSSNQTSRILNDAREAVGAEFTDDGLLAAQKSAWILLDRLAGDIKVGMTETDARNRMKEIAKEMGCKKMWHPPQIRFGRNTTCAFGETGEKDVPLQDGDMFFLDLGPVFSGYEGDVGAAYTLNGDTESVRLAADARAVFTEVRDHWLKTGLTGEALYEFAEGEASRRGWRLSLKGASGHRVSEFPHAVHHRGKLKSFDSQPVPNRWILEIHLFHPSLKKGAFFEDLL